MGGVRALEGPGDRQALGSRRSAHPGRKARRPDPERRGTRRGERGWSETGRDQAAGPPKRRDGGEGARDAPQGREGGGRALGRAGGVGRAGRGDRGRGWSFCASGHREGQAE